MPEPQGTVTFIGESSPGSIVSACMTTGSIFESDGYVVIETAHAVLIDPLPMTDRDLSRSNTAICLTASCHRQVLTRDSAMKKV
jgi:hypothetical protein